MTSTYRVISLDAESNGLDGRSFCIGMTLNTLAGEQEAATFRCPIDLPVDSWVEHNVLPVISDIRLTHASYADMLTAFRQTWETWGGGHPDTRTLVHVQWPVEAGLLLDAFRGDFRRGPYPVIDIADSLDKQGYDPRSVDGYLRAVDIAPPPGSPHNPLYDCRAAERANFHLVTGGRRR